MSTAVPPGERPPSGGARQGQRVLLVGSHLGILDQIDTCLARGLRFVGCDVRTFDYQASALTPRLLTRLVPRRVRSWLSPRRVPALAQADATASNRRFLACVSAFRPAVIIALRAERLSAEALHAAQTLGAITINWIGDEPWRFIPPAIVPSYHLWVVIDQTWAAWLKTHDARHVEHLPFACDPELHHPVALSAAERRRWASAICFVGSYTPQREQLLAAVADVGLGIWGPGWERAQAPSVRRCVRAARRLRREEWLAAYAAAQIVLNIQSQGPEGLSLRVWEAVAAGACLVSDGQADIARFLKDVVIGFGDAEELHLRCQELLATPETRRRLAQAGRAWVLAHHTVAHRAQTLLHWADELHAHNART